MGRRANALSRHVEKGVKVYGRRVADFEAAKAELEAKRHVAVNSAEIQEQDARLAAEAANLSYIRETLVSACRSIGLAGRAASAINSVMSAGASGGLGGVLGALGKLAGFETGTPGAPPGWAWTGERGPELIKFQGGETVIPHGPSMAVARGYANGTPGGVASDMRPIVVNVDGHKLFTIMKNRTASYNTANNKRQPGGSVLGVMAV